MKLLCCYVSFTWIFFCSACFGLSSTSLADDLDNLRPADTSSPRATLQSFLGAMNEVHGIISSAKFMNRSDPTHLAPVKRALDCLDQSQLPEYQREEFAAEAALCLKEVLDRVELPSLEEIPREETAEGEVLRWRVPGTRITIARVVEGPQQDEYLFTSETVDRAAEYYGDVRQLPYRTTGEETSPGFYDWYISAPGNPIASAIVERLPNWARMRVAGMSLWQWVAFCFAALLAALLMALTYRVEWRVVQRYRETRIVIYLTSIVFLIFAAIVPLLLGRFAYEYLTIRGSALYFLSFGVSVVALLASIVIAFGLANRVAAAIIASPRINPESLDAQFIRIMARILSIALSVVILIEGGSYLGIPVTTLLASAGIGGLAFALAAQDMLKNLFGTVMLLMDKPFRTTERIVFDNYDGFVEEIGLRSTKLRLLHGHLATIPNDQLARADIENVSRRPFIRGTATIELPSSTPTVKLKRAVEIVKSILDNHEGMDETRPPRVFLRDFKPSSVGLFVMYWYHPPEYWEFLAFNERLNLTIIEKLEFEEIPFASPELTISMGDQSKLLARDS